MQVTILRDKKQQTLTLQVDSKHHSELEEIFPGENWPAVAEIGANEIEQLREQMDELGDSFNAGGVQDRSATDGSVTESRWTR